MQSPNYFPVACFGEVLWDMLPSGTVPGGAPMNVAFHLKKLGCETALITKVGIDGPGQKLFDMMEQHGISTGYFQVDPTLETGKVYATICENDEVVYDIVKPVAWDFIEWEDQLTALVEKAEFFVFGSLAARNPVSANTLFRLLEIARYKILDINLRAPHFNRGIVESLLQKADFVKMNHNELELITGWFSPYATMEDRMEAIVNRFKLSGMAVTKGGDGATLVMDGTITHHPGFKITVVDTVGSGDAFLAGLVSKFLTHSGASETLEFASAMGAFMATQQGGCPVYERSQVEELQNRKTTIAF